MEKEVFLVNCVSQFTQGLHPDLRKKVEATYPDWHQQHACDSLVQKVFLARILKIAATAEIKLDSMAVIIGRVNGNLTLARAFKSQVEKTIDIYQNKGRGRRKPVCFGCNGDHCFARNGETVCSKTNEPGIRATANAKHKEISDRKANKTGAQERWRKDRPDLVDFSGKSPNNIKSQVFPADANGSSITMAESYHHRNNNDCGPYYAPSHDGRPTDSNSGRDSRSCKRIRDHSTP